MATGPLYSFTDTGNNIRTIADVINMIDWQEAPLLRIFGFSQKNVTGKFKIRDWPSTKPELLEDTMPGFTTTLDGAHNNSTTTIDVAAGTGQYFRTGDLIGIYGSDGQIAEKLLVDSVTTDALTVTGRGYGSTSAASHDTGRTVEILTRIMPEGADYTTGYTTATTQPYNYTQIISEAVKASKTGQKISKYGIDDYMDYHVSKLFADGGQAGRLAQFLQKTFYYGERVQRDGNNDGSMGGFRTFVTTHVDNLSGAALQRSHIHKKIRDIRQAGGRVTHLVTGAWGVEKITSMYEDLITTTRDETIGGSEIMTVKTPHGQVKLVYDWMCPQDHYFFCNADKIGWIPLRDFERGKIAEQGDYFVTDVVGEYSFLVSNEKSHGLIYGASTTS